MATDLTELRVFQMAEELGGLVWDVVAEWDWFARKTVGEQLVRSADSVGANIAEAYGRYHYGDKLRFLYFARGSLFETRFWLRQAYRRGLLNEEQTASMAALLGPLAIGINNFANSIKQQRNVQTNSDTRRRIEETRVAYQDGKISQSPNLSISTERDIFTPKDISCLINLNAS